MGRSPGKNRHKLAIVVTPWSCTNMLNSSAMTWKNTYRGWVAGLVSRVMLWDHIGK